MPEFLLHLKHYVIEIIPALALGFFLSGLLYEFVPQNWVEKHLGNKGIKSLLYVTLAGIFLPLCCIGSLPVALSLRKKGVPLGPVLAFMAATPATSVSAIIVTWHMFGIIFTFYLCVSVVIIALSLGLIGNRLKVPDTNFREDICPHCHPSEEVCPHCRIRPSIRQRFFFAMKFGFIDQPKEMGIELIIAVVLAAVISSVPVLGSFIRAYLFGAYAYLFALVFGLLMYFCSTASVPLVYALTQQGLNIGAGLVLLIAGPITSYPAMLIIRKEFGAKILAVYIAVISVLSLALGYVYFLVRGF